MKRILVLLSCVAMIAALAACSAADNGTATNRDASDSTGQTTAVIGDGSAPESEDSDTATPSGSSSVQAVTTKAITKATTKTVAGGWKTPTTAGGWDAPNANPPANDHAKDRTKKTTTTGTNRWDSYYGAHS